jgi:uncharacterized Zn-binding protein involved in type VI secretion
MDSGTPQGGIISSILANMVLDGIEALDVGDPRQCKVFQHIVIFINQPSL